ncbi:MAG: SurA N-terminal domain-containing protein [Gammaproteobacteria bacterium]|nr:SurA N-terminal domain-containing protein [Gammaproteobacteria bacterium]MBU1775582.1 SurA N-terminal domain-containing protein [Gammaproteobacteria bacterium]MBU1968659.1 SurA N-terminal domain-containing protein [Gammaproteobacteria bacterium]
MFDFVHEKKRIVQVVLALIILPFAFWGVDSYRNAGGPAALAKVNGEDIGQLEFENALDQQRQRIRELAGDAFDPAMFDRPEVKYSVLEGLVTRHLMLSEARSVNLIPGDAQIAQVLLSIDEFRVDGRFDKQRYLAALNERGMNQFQFESQLGQDIALQRLADAYTQNGYASDTVVERLIRLNEQQRVVSVMKLDADRFVGQARVSDADISAYYEQHAAEFQLPERANVEYVLFSADTLMPSISVSDAEIKQYYDDHISEFGTQEQRQAAHILIAVSRQAPEAEKQEAKAKAVQVLQQVKQAPANFAALAKQHSQDPGSAASGGDLGMFGRGAMMKPFDDSVFSLKKGEVSELVESDYGFHIIKLLAIKPAELQPLAAVRGMIGQRLRSQHAADRFAELAEKFNDTVYEQSDTLKPAAELAKVAIKRGVWLSKGQPASEPWTDKVLQAVFSDEALKDKRNTEAIEVAPNTLLAARVVEYKPASSRPLAEVASLIRGQLQRMQASEMAVKQGATLLEQLQRGEKVKPAWQAAQSISRSQHAGIDPALVQAVFRAGTGKLPAYVGIENAQVGYALARIEAVREIDSIDAGKRLRYAQQIRQMTGGELLQAHLQDAKKSADITIKPFAADAR